MLVTERGEMPDSTAALRELVVSFECELLGLAASRGDAPDEPREQVRQLTQQFLNQLLGMDVDVS